MKESQKKMLREWLELWRKSDGIYVRFLKRWDLSLNEYFVLRWLYENPEGMEPAQLAEAAAVQRQLVTSILREFESRKLTRRQDHPTDLRRRVILLTEAGRDFAGTVTQAVDELDLKALSTFSEEEQALLMKFSQKFYEGLCRAL